MPLDTWPLSSFARKAARTLSRYRHGLLAAGVALILISAAMLHFSRPTGVHDRFGEGLQLGWTRLAIEQLRFQLDEQAEAYDPARDAAMGITVQQIVERLDEPGFVGGERGVPLTTQRFIEAARRTSRLGRASTADDYEAASAQGPAALADLDRRLNQEWELFEAFDGSKHGLSHRGQYVLASGCLLLLVSLFSATLERKTSAQQAADSRYRSIFERHPLPILVHDADSGLVVDANPAAAKQYGYALDLLRGLQVARLRPPAEDGDLLTFPDVETAEFVGLWTHRKGDGSLFMAEVATSKFEDGDRRLRLSVVQDVTERERTLHRLSAEESRFRSLAESLKEGVLVTDLQGRVTYANPQVEQITGRSPEHLVGRSVQDELDETHGTIERRILDRRRGISETYLQEIEKPDGTRVWLEVHSSPLTGVEGRVAGVVAAVNDVTQRVEAESSLRDRESRLRTVLQQVPALVWTTDLEFRFTSLEGGMLDETMVKPESVSDMVDDGLAPRALEAHGRAIGGATEIYELEFADRWFRCRVEPYRNAEGVIVGTVGVALDVTKVKRAEKERERLDQQLRHAHKMEAVGRLAGGIAHDFNNLLTIIDGNAEMHSLSIEGEIPIELVEIREAAHSAASLTQQLLAFSRQQHIQPRVVLVDPTVRQTCRLLRRVIGEDIEMVVVEGCDDARIEVDTAQLHQVLLNLAINARDAMPDGGRLEIRTGRRTLESALRVDGILGADDTIEPGEYVRIEVQDDGTGMDDATLERIFEPFFTTKKPDVGTGLGLSTVHGIVRQSGGFVAVESRLGEGTTFTLFLPLSDRKDSPWMLPPRPAARTRGSARVLLVEDEAGLRRMLGRGLKKRGYTVLEAANGASALELATRGEEPIDLVVTDVLMPDMRGPELTRRLREAGVEAGVLFISGYTDHALGGDAASFDYLQKPFTVEALVQEMEKILRRPAGENANSGSTA